MLKNIKHEEKMNKMKFSKYTGFMAVALVLLFATSGTVSAQYATRWLNVGSLQNWYSEIGSEIEEGLQKSQQYGLRWPAIYAYKDNQAWKGIWVGAKNVVDESGSSYPYRVVHVGPRVQGGQEFFPIEFELRTKFAPPTVTVDGLTSMGSAPAVIDAEPNPDMAADRVIYNKVNNLLGLTMERRIMQFSQPFHDNYIINEYTFTNTGNTDGDEEIELPNQTLEEIYVYFQYRWAVTRETRYVIGNGSGWGMNTMLDTRGDGVKADPDADFRAQFAWHGNFPGKIVNYDNVGGPIWQPDAYGYTSEGDTVGRLGAAAMVGVVTLHADASASDSTDDPAQPSTTSYISSDDRLESGNDPFNVTRMMEEYGWMSAGHKSPRHADVVEPDGDYATATGDPSLGTSGGFSAANGYGPYTLAPGESFKIVWAEAADGLSYEKSVEIGKQFKNGSISAVEKNEWVLTAKDSLFDTFEKAIANYESGYDIPQAPLPPKTFEVVSGGDKITLNWEPYEDIDGPAVTAYEIYRAQGRYDSTYYLIHTADPDETTFEDRTPLRGVNYYYYIVSVGDPGDNDGTGLTPRGALKSSRYYTQTYDPAVLKRPAGKLEDIRIVPNPYIISSNTTRLRFDSEPDKLAFYNIPGQCTIQIFTELGEEIYKMEHTDGSGDAYWNSVTSSNQIVVSGIYIAVITDNKTGEKKILKFAVVR